MKKDYLTIDTLTLRSLATGYYVEWNGSSTFNVFDRDGNNVHAFMWFGEEGEAPSELKARSLMTEHLQEYLHG